MHPVFGVATPGSAGSMQALTEQLFLLCAHHATGCPPYSGMRADEDMPSPTRGGRQCRGSRLVLGRRRLTGSCDVIAVNEVLHIERHCQTPPPATALFSDPLSVYPRYFQTQKHYFQTTTVHIYVLSAR